MRNTENVMFCIPKDIVKLLDDYHKQAMVPKSKLVARLLKEFLEKQTEKK